MITKFDHLENLNDTTTTFFIAKPSGYSYLAGQYAEITFPDEHRDSIGDNRWFSLSSSPTEKDLAFTTKFYELKSDFKNRLLSLKSSDELVISEAIGDYVLPIDKNVASILIAGGIGITPVRSIVKYLIDTKDQRKIKLYYFVKSQQDALFTKLFDDYGLDYSIIVLPEVKTDVFEYIKERDSDSIYFVSGTQKLVEDTTFSIRSKIKNSQVVMDYFPGYTTL